MKDFFDLDKVRLGVDNNRLSALLCAVLQTHGGFTIIPKDISERVFEGYTLGYEQLEGGAVKVSLIPRH